jgi:hypothetical protein
MEEGYIESSPTDGLVENEAPSPRSDFTSSNDATKQQKYSTFQNNELLFHDINMKVNVKINGKKYSKQILSSCRYERF